MELKDLVEPPELVGPCWFRYETTVLVIVVITEPSRTDLELKCRLIADS